MTAELLLVGGGGIGTAVDTALTALQVSRAGTIAIAVANARLVEGGDELVNAAGSAFRSANRAPAIVAPARSVAGSWLAVRTQQWQAIELTGDVQQLDRVWMPAALAAADAVVLLNRVEQNEPIAIGAWARLAHPRQRTGARLSDARSGLTAEIARGIKPRVVLLAADIEGLPLLFASTDQIAIELAGIATRQIASGDDDPSGPWEDPLVQRATELGIGARLPTDIHFDARWIGADHPGPRERFVRLAALLADQIGVNHPAVDH